MTPASPVNSAFNGLVEEIGFGTPLGGGIAVAESVAESVLSYVVGGIDVVVGGVDVVVVDSITLVTQPSRTVVLLGPSVTEDTTGSRDDVSLHVHGSQGALS